MENARHPKTHKPINFVEHVKEFGNDELEEHERALCPVCWKGLSNRAGKTPKSHGHFAHRSSTGFCPTKIASGRPYDNLFPRSPNPLHAQQIKNLFRENWQYHFVVLNKFVHGLHADEFKEILKLANQQRIWEYANLEEFQIPYILATLRDFPPHTGFHFSDGSPARKLWFRCWFDSTIARYDDLWIHRSDAPKFIRGWYKNSNSKKKPNTDDLIDVHEMEFRLIAIEELTQPFKSIIFKLQPFVDTYF
jgi:hypothetical protein